MKTHFKLRNGKLSTSPRDISACILLVHEITDTVHTMCF